MGKALFAPDLFSRPNPVFQPVAPDLLENIKDILKQHYDVDPQKILSVGKLEGLEINSSNFRVDTNSDTYALKRVSKQGNVEIMDLQLDISQQLLQKGVCVPRIIKTKSDKFIARDQNSQIWMLSNFVQGTYFTGDKQHLAIIAKAIGDFQNSLEEIKDADKLPLNAGTDTWLQTTTIFQQLFSRKAQWNDLFPASEALALAKEGDHLKHCFDKICAFEKVFRKHIIPTHIDLHPHNILIDRHDHPTIVDIDSLQRADKTQSMAFATFKLLRQYIVHEDPSDKASSVAHFMNILNVPDADSGIWGAAAMAEVLRRIGIIANLNMQEANRQWNKVLHMQLAALHEIPHIFTMKG
jgi:Ser/Thr protein kinase RdoA (MazF antagonist)